MAKKRSHCELITFEDRDHEALMGVWWTGVLLKKRANRFFSEFLSSEVQFNIMMVLKHSKKSPTQNELGERLLVDKSNITGLLDRMEAAGLLKRVKVAGDRRCYHIELTKKGLKMLERLERPYRKHVKKLMSIFTAKEIDNLNRCMARLQEAITKEEPVTLEDKE